MQGGALLRFGRASTSVGGQRRPGGSACCSSSKPCQADLISWAAEDRPKSGRVSKAALARLKVKHLRSELSRRSCQETGSKAELVSRLLKAVDREWATVCAQQGSKAGEASGANANTQLAAARYKGRAEGHGSEDSAKEGTGPEAEAQQLGTPVSSESAGPSQVPQRPNQAQGKNLGVEESNNRHPQSRNKAMPADRVAPDMDRRDRKGDAMPGTAGAEASGQGAGQQQTLNKPASDAHSPTVLVGPIGQAGDLLRDEMVNEACNNATGMQIIFLGTSSSTPTRERSLSCLAFRNSKDIWLFDAGEDTQRQVVKHPCIRPGKFTRLFMTGTSPDLLMGIPGLLCTIGAAREQGHEGADVPVHVYGPVGLASFLQTVMDVSFTYLEMPVVVHEFTTNAVKEDEKVQLLSRRAKLWRVLIPPDKINPNGWHDADLLGFQPLLRHRPKRTGKHWSQPVAVDTRECFREHELPPPGEPARHPLTPSETTWTLRISHEFKVVAAPLRHCAPSLAYIVDEANRAGALNSARATELGVQEGRDFGRLKAGESVVSKTGDIVTPDMVLGPDCAGRRVVIVGDTNDASPIARLANKADILAMPVTHHHGVNTEDRNKAAGVTARAAGKFAESVAAKHLVLRHLDPRVEGEAGGALALAELSEAEFSGPVTAASDLYMHTLDRPQPMAASPPNSQPADIGLG